MQLIFSVCLLGILSVSLCQFKYYVDAVNGTDLMGYGSKEHPVRTLTYALDHMEGNTSIIYLRKVQNFSDLTSTMKIISDLNIKCWMDEETTPSPESYPTIFLNSSEISFIVAGNLTFDGIRFQKPDNISLKTLINITSSAKLSLQNLEISNYSSGGLEPLISSESNSSIYFENVTFSRLIPMPASLIKFNGDKFQMNGVNVIGCKFTDSPAFNLNGSFSFNLRNSRFELNILYSNPLFLLTTETEEQLVIDTVNVKSNLGSPLQKGQSMTLFLLLDSKSSKMSLSNSSFDQNSLFDCNGTTGMNVTGGQFNATNCNFSNNQALAMNKGYGGTGVLTIYSSKVSLQNLSCKSNYHQKGGAIYLEGTSNLSISGSNFAANKAGGGGAIYFKLNREVSIRGNSASISSEDNTFSNGEALIGGAVAIQGISWYIDKNSSYINNSASYGGALYCEQGEYHFMNIFLSKNHADDGGCLYVKNATLKIGGSKFFNCTADKGDGGAIFMTRGNITISSVVFESNVASYGRGGALFIEVMTSNLIAVTFLKNKAMQGGGLFATNKETIRFSNLLFANLMFEQNVAFLTGGGVHLESQFSVSLTDTIFLNNSGYDPKRGDSLSQGNLKGGAIFYSCQSLGYPCTAVFSSLDVRSNSAEIGGAIYFNDLIFSPIGGSNFANNSATRYGSTFASYPYQLWISQELCNGTNPRIRFSFENGTDFTYDNFIQNFFIYNWTDERHWNRIIYPQNISYPNMSMEINYSGQIAGTPLSTSLSFYALDVFGQQITEDGSSHSVKSIPFNGTSEANTISIGSVDGSFSFDRFYSSRNTNITLGIQTSIGCKVFSSSGITIKIQYRECQIGETLPYKSDICTACPPNTYSLIFPENSSVLCQTCDNITGLMCKEGGSHLAVGLGYWRFNTSSLNVIPCLNPDSCIPTVPDTNNCSNPLKPANLEKSCASISSLDDMKALNLSCSTQQQLDDVLKYCDLVKNGTELGFCNEQKGYKAGGILCTECAEGWGKSNEYECVKCKPNFWFFGSMILVGAVKIALIAFTVHDTRKETKDESDSTMLGILITFFQIESLLLSVPMYWPPIFDKIRRYLVSFFLSINPGGYSYECIFYWTGMKTLGLASYSASNALYSFFASIIWTIVAGMILSIRRLVLKNQEITWQAAQDILKITFLVTYFYFWPDMITSAFNTLHWINIGPEGVDEWRLFSDPSMVWNSGSHKILLILGITALTVSGICLPFFFFLKIWKNKNLLDDEKFIQTYGFIYRGYREEYYLWEFLILLQKMALVATSVFFVQQLTLMCVTLSIIMVISFGLQLHFSPFKSRILNRLELTAQICLAAINYGSLYHLKLESTISTILFVTLATGATALFLIPWIRVYKGALKENVESVYRFLKACSKRCWTFFKRIWGSQSQQSQRNTALTLEFNQDVSDLMQGFKEKILIPSNSPLIGGSVIETNFRHASNFERRNTNPV